MQKADPVEGCFLRVMIGKSIGVCPSQRENITDWKVIHLKSKM